MAASASVRFGHAELPADAASGVFVEFAMSRHGGLFVGRGVDPNRVALAFAQQTTSLLPQAPLQVERLHGAMTPAGASAISVLVRRCK